MKPGGENSKSNCVSDNSDFFFMFLWYSSFHPDIIGAFQVNTYQFQPSE